MNEHYRSNIRDKKDFKTPLFSTDALKCPYYGLWKVHILVLEVPNNRLTISLSYNMHLFFLPYRLNDLKWFAQRLARLVSFSCHHVMPDKAVFVSTVLLCVQRYRRNRYFYRSKNSTLWQRMNLHFHSDQRGKWAGNMLIFHVDVNMKQFGIRFKNESFQWFRVDSFFWAMITLVHFQI